MRKRGSSGKQPREGRETAMLLDLELRLIGVRVFVWVNSLSREHREVHLEHLVLLLEI